MKTLKKLPGILQQEWNNRKGAVVFTTTSDNSIPNSIYVTCVSLFEENKILIANNYFDKTINNILSGSRGTILFLSKDDKPYQFKGEIEYKESGPEFNNMKIWNPKNHPGKGVAVLLINEVYSGAKKLFES